MSTRENIRLIARARCHITAHKGSRFTVPTLLLPPPKKNPKKQEQNKTKKDILIKRSLGLELWDLNTATFQRIFATQDVDRSDKPLVVVHVLVMSLHINWKFCYVDSTSSKY